MAGRWDRLTICSAFPHGKRESIIANVESPEKSEAEAGKAVSNNRARENKYFTNTTHNSYLPGTPCFHGNDALIECVPFLLIV